MVTHHHQHWISLFQNEFSLHVTTSCCSNDSDSKSDSLWWLTLLKLIHIQFTLLYFHLHCSVPFKFLFSVMNVKSPTNTSHSILLCIYSTSFIHEFVISNAYTCLCMLLCIQSNIAWEMDFPRSLPCDVWDLNQNGNRIWLNHVLTYSGLKWFQLLPEQWK